MNSIRAQSLLLQCRGDEIWSMETCRQQGVPDAWIDELVDAFESGYDADRNTIYENGQMVNQYHGVSDLQLAYKLAEYLGIDCQQATQFALSRQAQVTALKEAVEEL